MRARLACLCTVFSCGLLFSAIAVPSQAAAPSVQELVTKLSDKDLQTRLDAAQTLQALGPGAAPALKSLTGLLTGDSTMLRWAAIDALGAIGGAAQSAVPALRPLLEDSSADIRRATISALAAIGHDDKIGAELTVALEDKDWLVQKAAVDAFIRLKRTDSAAIPPLVSALQRSEAPMRIAAAQALGQYGPAAGTAVSPLIQSLRDGNP
ncbi:MAG TPA: HEAT repeat domain-containing protein, partial [Limnochordia bacterium]|nr:HEAT repeat domain-containing protein [Limnochordia bacterium]